MNGDNEKIWQDAEESTSEVLAALRESTYRSVRIPAALPAALLESLIEHPTWSTPSYPGPGGPMTSRCTPKPLRSLLVATAGTNPSSLAGRFLSSGNCS